MWVGVDQFRPKYDLGDPQEIAQISLFFGQLFEG